MRAFFVMVLLGISWVCGACDDDGGSGGESASDAMLADSTVATKDPDAGAPDARGPVSETGLVALDVVTETAVCGITDIGRHVCFGEDLERLRGSPFDPEIPEGHPARDVELRSVAHGTTVHCGRDIEGRLYCWGALAEAVGPRQVERVSTALSTCFIEQVPGPIDCVVGIDEAGPFEPPEGSYVDVDLGFAVGCGVREGGGAACWGLDAAPLLKTAAPDVRVSRITVENEFACGIRVDDDQLECWGASSFAFASERPRSAVIDVVSGNAAACAQLAASGHWECWDARLDRESLLEANEPDEPLYGVDVFGRSTSSGGGLACGFRQADDSPVCWGDTTVELPTF